MALTILNQFICKFKFITILFFQIGYLKYLLMIDSISVSWSNSISHILCTTTYVSWNKKQIYLVCNNILKKTNPKIFIKIFYNDFSFFSEKDNRKLNLRYFQIRFDCLIIKFKWNKFHFFVILSSFRKSFESLLFKKEILF
jgi:hypothetical protein